MHSNDTPASVPAAPGSSASLWIVQSFLRIVFGVALALLVTLAIASSWLGAGLMIAAMAVIGAVAWLWGARRFVRNPWMRLGLSYVMLGGVLGYLALDETIIRRPITLEDISPTFAGAEKSYDVLMRYGKAHALGREFHFQPSQKLYQGQGVWKPKDPQWSAWLAANRAELESGWAKLAPVRAWWAELNAFDRIADLTPPRFDAELLAFAPIRAFTQHACAMASLQAIDGHGDAAMETLLPVLEVCRKLEPSSRTLVRFMIARVAQRMAMETATFVLDTTSISPDARERLSRALEDGGCAGEKGARYVVGMEYAWAPVAVNSPNFPQFLFESETEHWWRRCLSPLRPIVLNSHRTLNLYGDLSSRLQDLAARRGVGDIDKCYKDFFAQEGRTGFKNFGGTLLLTRMIPAYKKIVEHYWTTEDLRSALQTRLHT